MKLSVIGELVSALEHWILTWGWNVQVNFPMEVGQKRGTGANDIQCLVQDRIQVLIDLVTSLELVKVTFLEFLEVNFFQQ